MAEAVIRHPVFVVGMPRSGTTLLSSMLDAHPEIAMMPETHFYTRCEPSSEDREGALEEVWARLQQQPGVQDLGLTGAEMRQVWEYARRQSAPDPSDLLRALGTAHAEQSSAAAWGEKTPDHLAHVPALVRDFPEAVVLVMVRDPRDVCLSLRGLPWNHDSLPESAWKWRRYARLTERYRAAYPHHVRELRYEALLEEPERVLRRVLDGIGAPFNRAVLSFHQRDRGPVDSEREPWKEKARRPVDPENKEKWRGQMGPAERWLVQRVTTPYLQRQEYSAPPVPHDGAFAADLARVLVDTVRSVVRRMVRRWRTPPRSSGDHRPVWVRREEAAE